MIQTASAGAAGRCVFALRKGGATGKVRHATLNTVVGQHAGGVGARRVGVGGRSGGGMSGRKRGATERRTEVTGGGVQRPGGGPRSWCRSSGELWWSSR